jgi:hypothetical protein
MPGLFWLRGDDVLSRNALAKSSPDGQRINGIRILLFEMIIAETSSRI